MGTDKRACMVKARELLATPSEETLRYAALELRMCMEFLTYEKLRCYANIVPPAMQAIWQPPQAVRALLEFEPDAERSFVVHVGKQEPPGADSEEMHFLGAHNALTVAWLRKHYNKLGNLLHAPSGNAATSLDVPKTVGYIEEVMRDLAAPLESTILGGNLHLVWSAQCTQCGKTVARNADAMSAGALATCFTPNCNTEYRAKATDEGTIIFEPVLAHLTCGKCGCDVALQPKKLDVGVGFKCPNCGESHRITGHRWEYVASEA